MAPGYNLHVLFILSVLTICAPVTTSFSSHAPAPANHKQNIPIATHTHTSTTFADNCADLTKQETKTATTARSFLNKALATALTTSALAFVLIGDPQQAIAAKSKTESPPTSAITVPTKTSATAARISLNTVPPSTVQLDIPVLGGTYAKVSDKKVEDPSVIIAAPKDLIGAGKAAVTGGHLEVDVNGIVNTHVDVDVAANEAGTLTANVASSLIPQLPFKNTASPGPGTVKPTGDQTKWFLVTNLGSGRSYYYNEETGVSQLKKPEEL